MNLQSWDATINQIAAEAIQDGGKDNVLIAWRGKLEEEPIPCPVSNRRDRAGSKETNVGRQPIRNNDSGRSFAILVLGHSAAEARCRNVVVATV